MAPLARVDEGRVRASFSNHACQYDQLARVQKRVVSELCRRLFAWSCPQGPILDIGTGTGGLAEALRGRLGREPLTVMDFAHGMTCEAHRRLGECSACDGDATRLPFRDESFQTVVSSSMYQWVFRLQDAFAEVRRILRPSGIFAVALFGERTLFELKNAHRHAVAACRLATPSHVQSFPTCDEVAAALAAADLTCCELVSYPEVDYHASVADLLRELKQVGAGNASRNRPRGFAPRQVMQTMMEHYAATYRESQGFPATYEVIVALVRKKGS